MACQTQIPNQLINYFTDYMSSDSLFQKMVDLGAPWSSDVGLDMDIAYFTMYSGEKFASNFVRLNSTNLVPNSVIIAQVLYHMFSPNWERLWNAMLTTYKPIENYNIQETVVRDETDDRTINSSGKYDSKVNLTQNNTRKDTTSSTTDSNGTSALEHGHIVETEGETDMYQFGFNSETQVPTTVQKDSGTQTNSGTDTTTTTDHSQNDSTLNSTNDATGETTQADTSSDDTKDNNVINETITRNRVGNVGQNSYQELLRQEFELWKWNFYKQVFQDVDSYLALSIF